jgi:hypothetical protein
MVPRGEIRPAGIYLLLAALLLQSLSGLVGGLGLVTDPTGSRLGIPIEWLTGSPFNDYLIPGLVLLFLLGALPLLVSYGVWVRRYWSWSAALFVGLALLTWIGVEILIIGYQPRPPLQLAYGAVGLVILVLTLLPSVRGHLGRSG